MMGKKKKELKLMYVISLDDMVPEDNFYRQLDKLLDLRFLYQECKNIYGTTGNPSIDPVVFFKMLLFGYVENIIKDRELLRRASDSLSVRYFLGYDIDEELPWHSTISRTRKLLPEEVFERLFSKVVELCVKTGLVGGTHQSIDSTLVKANASMETIERKKPEMELIEYIKRSQGENRLEVENGNKSIRTSSERSPSDLLDKKMSECVENQDETKELEPVPIETEVPTIESRKTTDEKSKRRSCSNKDYYSRTDPDSRIAKKPGKLTDLYYSTNYCVDSQNNIITDVFTTHADQRDSEVLMEVVSRASNRLNRCGLSINSIAADRNYCSGKNLKELEEQGITAYIPTQRYPNTHNYIDKKEFSYNKERDTYLCPNGKELSYCYLGKKKMVKVYQADRKDCHQCRLKAQCTGDDARRVQHTVYLEQYERLERLLKTPFAKRASVLRKIGPEPLFAEAKGYHGLSKFMTRGRPKAQKNSYLIATVQNLKRLMRYAKRRIAVESFVIGMGEFLFKIFFNIFLYRIRKTNLLIQRFTSISSLKFFTKGSATDSCSLAGWFRFTQTIFYACTNQISGTHRVTFESTRNKNYKYDARMLAHHKPIRYLRELIFHRSKLLQIRTKLKV